MYPKYFGLNEPSFAITPDPRFLYLSEEHQEALAHLLYGAAEGGGFVLLTGEVGTGKTTVCRTFLEQLPDQVDVALILNPALTALDLLHAICAEYGIQVPADTASIRVLVAALNDYLLAAHSGNRRPVLLIDEAQNLTSEVLEQIRLLTNLETHTHKLLQIFLVGQPELRELLKTRALRQLSQRITARYHLKPLARRECTEYIAHRLAVAGVERPLFTTMALRRIYQLSGGIPRLINIFCDRSLLGAYVTNKPIVNRRIVNRAVRELRGQPAGADTARLWIATAAACLMLLGSSLFLYDSKYNSRHPEQSAQAVIDVPPLPVLNNTAKVVTAAAPSERPIEKKEPSLALPSEAAKPLPAGSDDSMEQQEPASEDLHRGGSALLQVDAGTTQHESLSAVPTPAIDSMWMDRKSGIQQLLARWGMLSDATYGGPDPCDQAFLNGLHCRQGKGDWSQIRRYDRPILIELTNQSQQAYALVTGLGPRYATLTKDAVSIKILRNTIDPHWHGNFLFLWKPPIDGDTLIGPGANQKYVTWIQQTLTRIPGFQVAIPESKKYDAQLQDAVRRFQRQHRLTPDGLVGPETIIVLNTQAAIPGIPKLEQAE